MATGSSTDKREETIVSRADYDAIKQGFGDYVKTWHTRDLSAVDRIVHTDTAFKTSTSKTMANGDQDSIYGVYDFVNDFPETDMLYTPTYNYACRLRGEEAFACAEVVCTAFKTVPELSWFAFTVFVAAQWAKLEDDWRIVSLRQEVVPQGGPLRGHFEERWHFEEADEVAGRVQVVRGEGDAPWLNIPDGSAEDVLTEKEKVKDCIIKNAYGVEQQVLSLTLDTYSVDYQYHRRWHSEGERAKDRVQQLKVTRNLLRYYSCPLKFRSIEIVGDRAFAQVDRVRGHQPDLGFKISTDGDVDLRQRVKDSLRETIPYTYTMDNTGVEHTVARGTYELVKEGGAWKVAFDKLYYGLYEVGPYQEESFGDEC